MPQWIRPSTASHFRLITDLGTPAGPWIMRMSRRMDGDLAQMLAKIGISPRNLAPNSLRPVMADQSLWITAAVGRSWRAEPAGTTMTSGWSLSVRRHSGSSPRRTISRFGLMLRAVPSCGEIGVILLVSCRRVMGSTPDRSERRWIADGMAGWCVDRQGRHGDSFSEIK